MSQPGAVEAAFVINGCVVTYEGVEMSNAISALFGGNGEEQAKLAKEQRAELAGRQAEEKRKKDAQLQLLRGLQGGQATMFQETGNRGVMSNQSEVLG